MRGRGRCVTRSRGGIARSLELIELRLRRFGPFGCRKRANPVPLEPRLGSIGDAVLLAFGRFIVRSAGREELPNPISKTRPQHLRLDARRASAGNVM